jgi:hypothetical protein
MNKLRQLIRESINDYVREIDEAGNVAALEAKMGKTQEAIELREKKMNMEGIDEAYHDMLDKGKLKELGAEVKVLEKSLAKYKKMLEKLKSKANKGEKVEDTEEKEEIIDEVNIDEMDSESDSQLEETDDMSIYEILHMQKMAGIISESEYVSKINEAKKKKASADMTKKAKSAVVKKAEVTKKARVDKDIDEKKPKSLKEQVKALFENEGNEGTINFGSFKNVEWYSRENNKIFLVVTESDNFRKIENSMTLNPNADTYTDKERSFLNNKLDELANNMSDYLVSVGVENEVFDSPMGYGQEIDNLVIEINKDDLNKIK